MCDDACPWGVMWVKESEHRLDNPEVDDIGGYRYVVKEYLRSWVTVDTRFQNE